MIGKREVCEAVLINPRTDIGVLPGWVARALPPHEQGRRPVLSLPPHVHALAGRAWHGRHRLVPVEHPHHQSLPDEPSASRSYLAIAGAVSSSGRSARHPRYRHIGVASAHLVAVAGVDQELRQALSVRLVEDVS